MALAARSIAQNEQTYRSPPQNIEAEQALLGAILVNNDAFYRVSDFLEASHFFEPSAPRIFEVAGEPDPRRQDRQPGHAEDLHRRADLAIGEITVTQYLARLAAEATTIINAEDYGRTIYDLALRRAADRHRRGHGQRRL
jgi:replicative DNA helicase